MEETFGPVLDGIDIPETIVLPPEILPLLPWMNLAELKITIAAIARLMQVGGAEPITLSEFQQLTGLSRTAVLDGIERAMKRGVLTRFEITGYRGHTMHVYELKPRLQKSLKSQNSIGSNFLPIDDSIGSNFLPITPIKAKQSKDVVVESESSTTNFALLNLSDGAKNSQKMPDFSLENELFLKMRKIGVYPKTARFLLANFPLDRIAKFLAIYPTALRVGRADGPGWLVKAISDSHWDPESEQEDLSARVQAHIQREQEQAAPKATLPKAILRGLQAIGWVGDLAEIEQHFQAEPKRVRAWLRWAKMQPQAIAAARFLTGLRSGLQPPAAPQAASQSTEWDWGIEIEAESEHDHAAHHAAHQSDDRLKYRRMLEIPSLLRAINATDPQWEAYRREHAELIRWWLSLPTSLRQEIEQE